MIRLSDVELEETTIFFYVKQKFHGVAAFNKNFMFTKTFQLIWTKNKKVSKGQQYESLFTVVASGLCLPGGEGLLDPCEREGIDAMHELTDQEREDLTTSGKAYFVSLVIQV